MLLSSTQPLGLMLLPARGSDPLNLCRSQTAQADVEQVLQLSLTVDLGIACGRQQNRTHVVPDAKLAAVQACMPAASCKESLAMLGNCLQGYL